MAGVCPHVEEVEYSQHKAGQCSCGNGVNCCCRSGVGSWTSPPPQGWPPPIRVCRANSHFKKYVV